MRPGESGGEESWWRRRARQWADDLGAWIIDRLVQRPELVRSLADHGVIDDIAGRVIDRWVRTPESTQALAEVLTPYLTLRLATTPILFGGGWDKVSLGAEVKLVNTLLNVSSGHIRIGSHAFFGHNVCLLTGTHDVSRTREERQDYPRDGRDIVIGEGVWIASNATVLGPCVIGDHAVVAAGALVAGGELEAQCLYAGVPARKIRELGVAV